MTISGGSTVAYTYAPRITDGGTIVEQRRTTALSANCDSVAEAIAALDAGKPTMVGGGYVAAVNDHIRAQGWQLVAKA